MDPLSILLWTAVWAGVSAGIYATVYFANLTLQILANWFRQFAYLIVENDRRPIRNREWLAVTVKEKINNGDYRIAQGIFNNQTDEFLDARAITGNSVDWKIEREHIGKEVVIW